MGIICLISSLLTVLKATLKLWGTYVCTNVFDPFVVIKQQIKFFHTSTVKLVVI